MDSHAVTKPFISIIIPTRNRVAFLKEAVASVSSQDYLEREIIVVDDASEDGTWEWLSSLQAPGIVTFRLERHGERSAARNLGLMRSRRSGRAFALMNVNIANGRVILAGGLQSGCGEMLSLGGRQSADKPFSENPCYCRWRVGTQVSR
jgi:glycosyltransferase involved in cell wall biosynthesis